MFFLFSVFSVCLSVRILFAFYFFFRLLFLLIRIVLVLKVKCGPTDRQKWRNTKLISEKLANFNYINNPQQYNDTAKQCGPYRDPSALVDRYSVKKFLFVLKKKSNLFLKDLIDFALITLAGRAFHNGSTRLLRNKWLTVLNYFSLDCMCRATNTTCLPGEI